MRLSLVSALSIFFCLLGSIAYGQCNDSFSKTATSITINWDITTCSNLNSSGDLFEICWKGGPNPFTACATHSHKSTQKTGSFTITGLQASGTYGLITQYRRKVFWKELNRRTVTTDAAPSVTPSLSVSPAQAGCVTFTWANVPSASGLENNTLTIQARIAGNWGPYIFVGSENLNNMTPNGSKQVCGLSMFKRHRAVVEKVVVNSGGQSAPTLVTNWVTFY